ncbi:DUF4255 domain-containing protein [Terriglobus roseus]|uniref:DUF4255 domain-containing protein n=1 Tax=Terriglobus roseus TaxID=392734 RepID=UPI00030EEFB9|nr:DUF4255 domain-containing protein [Terriglobus roseus]
MSTAMAIAAAARVVAQLIDRRVALENFTAFQSMKTTVLSPEQIDGTDMSATIDVPPHINIFPYHVAMNAAYRNAFEPSRNAFGQPVTTPPLALDISFLVSTHSSLELLPEMLLGLAMQALSDVPQLTRERVRTLLAVNPLIDPPDPVLVALQRSGLADQLEILRIEPLNLNADEMQKLWTSIHSRCRPSFCYRISAVLIESEILRRVRCPCAPLRPPSFSRCGLSLIASIRPICSSRRPPRRSRWWVKNSSSPVR